MPRLHPRPAALALAALVLGSARLALAADVDWAALRDESAIEILTVDPDGESRATKVWVVVVDGAAWLRTNDSRWLANIRRDAAVGLRVREQDYPFLATEVGDAAAKASVEQAFRAKYGFMQRVMSALRMREPTVLRLRPRT